MTMHDRDIHFRPGAGSQRTSRASFTHAEARGPIIDQEGREIRPESLRDGFRELETAHIQTFVAVFVERRARQFLEHRRRVHIGQRSL